MALSPCSLLGSISVSLLSSFPPHLLVQTPLKSGAKLPKLIVCKWMAPKSAYFGQYGACLALGELSDSERTENAGVKTILKDGFDVLLAMEERGLRPDLNTYLWLLDGCLNSCSLSNVKRVHCCILKSGFDDECVLGDKLVEVYASLGVLKDAIFIFDSMFEKSLASSHRIMSALLAEKRSWGVLGHFSRMVEEGLPPDSWAFSCALRACSASGVPFCYVEQIHSKVIRSGLSFNSVVVNPLIDLYAKSSKIDSAWLAFRDLHSKDSVSWVAMMSGFSLNGREEDALYLFCNMKKLGVIPTPYVYSSVLSSCTKSEHFDLGLQVHAQVLKWGYLSKTFVGNALLTLYCRCGKWSSAKQVFNNMPHHDGITYNSLISGSFRCGNCERALHFFQKMQTAGFKPDSVTLASLLSAASSFGALAKGAQLHSYVIKSGVSNDVIIEGSLLDLYVKCSDIETANKMFCTTCKENVVLWNVMLVAYGQLGNLRKSFDLFCQMQLAGMKPNQYTYPSILRTCTFLGAVDVGKQIHTLVVKNGFELNVYVCSVLIDMYAKCGELDLARGILDRLTMKDVVSWTAMIAGYAQHELYVDALKLFEDMQICGILSDNIGLSSALSACASIQALKQGQQIHAQAHVLGFSEDLSVGNSLVSLYARCGNIKGAYWIFEGIKEKDVVSWNSLIAGFAQSGQYEEALSVYCKMNQEAIGLNLFTFTPAISAAANTADIKQGAQIHGRMIKTGHDLEVEAGNALVSLYAKCGSLEDAERGFYLMTHKNEVSWNAMITGYSQHGQGREALKLFEEMIKKGYNPNHVTFVGVLSACSHVGLVNEGLGYFKSMGEKHGIAQRPEHYACVVDILGRSGNLDHAKAFIEEMPISPDAMVWKTLLSACRVQKNMEIGEFAAKHLLQLEPDDSATYVLLSNIYAVARKWDLRDQVRKIMKDRGVKKEPGRSWIEVKNIVHAFFVGDHLHPLADKIYEYLGELNLRVGEIGYVYDHYSLLHDIEQEQKDPSTFIHSEKLAVAFGLISLSPGMPIRVIKNLRMCNDCHKWMKFVSKVIEQKIIIRDAYRFHHFVGGVCSCGDYW